MINPSIPSVSALNRILARSLRMAGLVVPLALTGCAGGGGGGGGLLDKTLETLGLSKPQPPAMPTMPDASNLANDGIRLPSLARQVTLRLHAGETLNVDAEGRSLSLVARIYKLKSANAFIQAPYAAFSDADQQKKAFGEDIVEMREIVLTPGKKYEVIESMPVSANHLAVVALFRSPDPQRWRFVFDTKSVVRTGVTLGLHGCALSVAVGDPTGTPAEVRRLAGMQCPHS